MHRDHPKSPGRYARIYIGAGASVGTTAGVLALLQVGGVLVGPLGWPDGSQQLIRATRTSESSYAISPALAVQVCWPPCWRLGGGGVGYGHGGVFFSYYEAPVPVFYVSFRLLLAG